MVIATWNINSIRARVDRLVAWLTERQPDVLCLQETKVEDEGFPRAALEALGYQAVISGEKTYNGVAILAREPVLAAAPGLCDDDEDTACRLLAATVRGVRIISVYVPNGQAVGSEKYAYKLRWLARLRAYLDRLGDPAQPLVLAGDFNVAPEARDIHDPALWDEKIMCSEPERAALRHVTAWGLTDALRHHHPEPGHFTWWDYRQLSFPKGKGLRIDHVFLTPAMLERCSDVMVDRNARKGTQPSDHAPVLATFRD